MTVQELVEILNKLPADQQVFVRSYESGYDPIESVVVCELSANPSENWYEGRFDKEPDQTSESFQGVIIRGDQRSP